MDFKTLKNLLDSFEGLKAEQLEVDPEENVYLSIHFVSSDLGIYHYYMDAIYKEKYLRLKFEGHPTYLNSKNTEVVKTFQDILDAFENSEYVEDLKG